jgi:hypothetical protein
MTSTNDIEQYLNSLDVDYKIAEDDVCIQLTLPKYEQSILLKKDNDFEYSKQTIDSIFKDADLDVNQVCVCCNCEGIIWQLCHTCNEEVCISCFIKQRVLNHGANICSLCNAINNANIMTDTELENWVASTYEDIDNLIKLHNDK